MDPHCRAVGAVDLERFFGHHAQPEILEHRQNVGEGDRLLRPIQPQPGQPSIGGRMERDFERRACRYSLDAPQIRNCLRSLCAYLIGDREGLKAAQQGTRLLIAESRRGRLV